MSTHGHQAGGQVWVAPRNCNVHIVTEGGECIACQIKALQAKLDAQIAKNVCTKCGKRCMCSVGYHDVEEFYQDEALEQEQDADQDTMVHRHCWVKGILWGKIERCRHCDLVRP